jgi:AcrR family transcriptional regulator
MTPPDPRVTRTRAAVLDATADLLADVGFERITVDAIAERVGCARSTIYRNWEHPADVLIDGFRQLCRSHVPPDLGSLREELTAFGRSLARSLSDEPMGRALPSLIGAAAHDERLRTLLAEFSAERRAESLVVLERAVARGEVAAGTDLEAPLIRFVAPFFMHRLVTDLPLDDAFVAAQVDACCRELAVR